MSAQSINRPAFTRVEAIVVVVILVILVLIGLPSAITCRHCGGPNSACMNNLKQMALAFHTYQSTRKGKLPVGTVIGSAEDPEERLSGLVWLLPYLEQEVRYKKLDKDQGWRAEANRPLVAEPVDIFRCPGLVPHSDRSNNHTHYVGIAGVGEYAATLPAKHPRAGVFGHDRQLSVGDLTDGASNTLLFVETARNNGSWAAGGRSTLRGIDGRDERPIREGGAFGGIHPEKPWFRARRETWANVAMADGSVRGITQDVSPEVLAALATIAGGEEVTADW